MILKSHFKCFKRNTQFKKKQKVGKKFSINVTTCKDLRFILFNSAVMETAQAVNKFVGNY